MKSRGKRSPAQATSLKQKSVSPTRRLRSTAQRSLVGKPPEAFRQRRCTRWSFAMCRATSRFSALLSLQERE